jgi:hypothetical protein
VNGLATLAGAVVAAAAGGTGAGFPGLIAIAAVAAAAGVAKQWIMGIWFLTASACLACPWT